MGLRNIAGWSWLQQSNKRGMGSEQTRFVSVNIVMILCQRRGSWGCILCIPWHLHCLYGLDNPQHLIIQTSTTMGGTSSLEQSERFFSQITFIQELLDQHFGSIEIFRSKDLPYEYLMNYKRTFLQKDHTYNDYIQLVHSLQGKTHKNIAKLFYHDEKEEKQMCIQHVKVSTFFNYYNFTLNKALVKKREVSSSFPQRELWYVLLSLVDAAQFLRGNGISVGDFHRDRVFITPEGYIKLYLIGIAKDNRHNAYFEALCSLETLEKHLLAPEQLDAIVKGEQNISFNVYQSDMFAIGMIILELMLLDEAKFYYNYEEFLVNYEKIKYSLANLKGLYSNDLVRVVLACLEKNPAKRLDFEGVYSLIQNLKQTTTVAHSLRLNVEEEDRRQTSKPQITEIKSLSRQLNQKLVVNPISVISDKSFSDGTASMYKRRSNFTQSSGSNETTFEKRQPY